jgi:hypothetical protein
MFQDGDIFGDGMNIAAARVGKYRFAIALNDGGFSVPRSWFALDSPLEGDGFELLVPRQESPRFPKHPGTIAVPTV